MQTTPFRGALAALLAFAALVASIAPVHAGERGPVLRTVPADTSARVIVKYRSNGAMAGGAPQHAQVLGRQLGLTLTDGRAIGDRQQLVYAAGAPSQVLAQRLAALDDVEYAVADERRHAAAVQPSDPLYLNTAATQTPTAGQWYLRTPDSTWVSALGAETAWALTTGAASIVVAVLDTGIRSDHPDLAGKLYAGYDFVSDTTVANDGDGRDADPSDPGDWITSSENASGTLAGCGAADSSWHGTQTAGLIGAATDNALGMASVGRNVMLLPVRVLGKCGGYDSDIIDAMRWAAGLPVSGMTANPHPARVLNLSLGSSGRCSSAYQEVVNELIAAGVVVVAAAGNDGLAVNAPANCTGVVAVAGVRHSGTKVGYSSLGSQVKLSAPAGNCVNSTGTCLYPIVTTSNTGITAPGAASYTSGGSDASLGTSFSAPLVSGTVALMLSVQPTLTSSQVTQLLQGSARAFPSSGAGSGVSACLTPGSTAQTSECYCTTGTCGAGLLDAGAAVAAAQAATVSTPPSAAIALSASSVTVGNAITLDGSGSAGTSAALAAYAWTVTAGTGAARIVSGAGSAQATLSGVSVGTATVQLVVTDAHGLTATASASITVKAAAVGSTSSTSGDSGTSTTTPTGETPGAGSADSSSGGGALGAPELGLVAALGLLAAGRRCRARSRCRGPYNGPTGSGEARNHTKGDRWTIRGRTAEVPGTRG
jgi:serine protease